MFAPLSHAQLVLPPQPSRKPGRSWSRSPACSPSWSRAWRWMCGFGSRGQAISTVVRKENENESTSHSQDRHSRVDGSAARQATDPGADRWLCCKNPTALRAAAQPPRPVSGDVGLAAATDRETVIGWRLGGQHATRLIDLRQSFPDSGVRCDALVEWSASLASPAWVGRGGQSWAAGY
jgi:hypothetical protein